MSHYDYDASKTLSALDPPFYSLIMAAMRRADTDNGIRLAAIFPDVAAELRERYDAPGGWLRTDPDIPDEIEAFYAAQG